MTNDIEHLKAEIAHLAGETIALQNSLACVLRCLIQSGELRRATIEEAFRQADLMAEVSAIRMGEKGIPIHTAKQMDVIKYLRDTSLPD